MRHPNDHSPANDRSPTFVVEQQWIGRIRAGDEAAFKALYEHFSDAMFAFAFSTLRSRTDAEDVVHDVFLAITKQGPAWHVDGELRAYLFRAVYNAIATRRRHLRVELSSHESMVRDAGTPTEWMYRGGTDDALNERELADALARAIETLPPRTQQAYRLVREHHCSYATAAEVMEISVHTVEIHLVRALKALREQLAAWRST